ncbi:putative 2-dehydropantoate 2-reductase [Pseudomonas sp. JM0905a]|uniref:2-dehydropantoate 2-reductase n=1 Tax=Metapseudomonas resinovorans TaxID=53412 RepID=A0ABT4YA86_METRE|nr:MULTISPECIES: putative 2-dehydropantoate 2-reductase [Pseudomonas]MBD2836385.1 putative 2-dehydropantoate 2-reductase [Pseudomonas sp. JM0905a]MDA8485798.1 putative 2-dehydropantoate 2-reductase [Pseudomonas resinovorans]
MSSSKPRIGIIGTGAIGGFYGVMLARAGFDVHFLLRSEYDAVAARGLQLNSVVHGAQVLFPVQAYRNVADMPPCDWLLVGAKTTSNAALAPVIAQAAAPGAKVVLLQNGLAVEDELRPLLPESLHLLGGLCYICVHRSAPGVIEHQSLGAVNLGYHSGPARDDAERQALTEEGSAMFKAAGIDSAAVANLDQARWQKLVWNVPYNGLSVLLNAGTTALMGNADIRELIQAIMQEVVDAATAVGHRIPDNFAAKLLASTDRMPDYLPSMYHDFAQKRPLELGAIYEAPLAAASAAGFEMPRIRALYQALRFIDARNQG